MVKKRRVPRKRIRYRKKNKNGLKGKEENSNRKCRMKRGRENGVQEGKKRMVKKGYEEGGGRR
jgi:hypothetical protein